MLDRCFLILLFLPVLESDDSKVNYTDDGAIVTGLGFFKLNNPEPLTFELENYATCSGDLKLCYKADKPMDGSTPPCEPGYHRWGLLKLMMAIGFKDSKIGANKRFIIFPPSPYAVLPDNSDGFVHYQVIELPKNCKLKIIGATDPNPPKPTDKLKTAKLVIYILAGLAGAILLVAIVAVIYCVCFKRRNENTRGVDHYQTVAAQTRVSRATPGSH